MARPEKRRSTLARLQDQLDERTKECDQLRDAARQLMAGLNQYAKAENWKVEGTITDDGNEMDRHVWKDGEGAKVARYYLGLEEENN